MRVLVFGAIGTEMIVNGHRYEIVSLGEDQKVTWRGKCEACHTPIFVHTQWGQLPVGKRCQEHARKRLNLPEPANPAPEILEVIQARFPAGVPAPGFFVPGAAAADALGSPDMEDVEATAPQSADDGGAPEAVEVVVEEIEKIAPSSRALAVVARQMAGMADEGEIIPPAPAVDLDMWRRRLELYLRSKMWMSEWGAMPGKDGCRVPRALFREYRLPHLAEPVPMIA